MVWVTARAKSCRCGRRASTQTGGTSSQGKHARSGPRRQRRRHGPPLEGGACPRSGHWAAPMDGPRRRRDAAGRDRRGGMDGLPRTPTNSAQRSEHRREAAAGAERQRERRGDDGGRRGGDDAGSAGSGASARGAEAAPDAGRTDRGRGRTSATSLPPEAATREAQGRTGGRDKRNGLRAGRRKIAPYPRTPAQPAPQGTGIAPLPPAPMSSRIAERSEMGGWGERAHARVRGEGGRARSNGSIAGGPTTVLGGRFPSPSLPIVDLSVYNLHLTR